MAFIISEFYFTLVFFAPINPFAMHGILNRLLSQSFRGSKFYIIFAKKNLGIGKILFDDLFLEFVLNL